MGMAWVFETEKKANDFANEKNKTTRSFKYVVVEYTKSQGGNGQKCIVRKTRIKK